MNELLNNLTNLPDWARWAIAGLIAVVYVNRQGWFAGAWQQLAKLWPKSDPAVDPLPDPTPKPAPTPDPPKPRYQVPDNEPAETDLYLALRLLNEDEYATCPKYCKALSELNALFMNRCPEEVEADEE